ncbi:AAA family ATPase [Caldivirga sp. UBA161]|uniref:AAA family ATPase n=1 Tax=Caldivirga sp. UBA161 TaxID=1915569 RepID=UPI0025C04EC8|nr:AAA family ATPase [Caldivirga sp. UBA161]
MASVELIEIENIRSIRKATVRLSNGVNFIYGLNGAGKTTILDSIALALYGTDWLKRRRIRLSELVTIGASTGAVRLVVNIEGHRYIIQRAFTREKVIESQTYVMSENNSRVAGRDKEVTRWVTENLGIDVELFSLLYVRQGELRDILEVNRREEFKFDKLLKIDSMDKLQTDVLRGIEKRLEGEEKALEAAIRENNDEKDRVEGRLSEARVKVKEIESEINKLEVELSVKEDELSKLKEEERRLIGIRERFNALNDELMRLKGELGRINESIKGVEDKIKERDSIRARIKEIEEALKGVKELRDEVNKLEEEERDLRDKVITLESKESAIKGLERQRAELSNQLREIEAELEELRGKAAERSELEERLKEILTRLNELDELKSRKLSLKSEISHIEEELNVLKSSKEPVCPVCKRPLEPGDRERLIRENNERLRLIREEIREIDSRLRDYSDLKDTEEELRNRLTQAKIATERIPTLESKLRELRSRISELDEELKVAKEEVKELDDVRMKHKGVNARLSELRRKLTEAERLQEEYVRLNAELAKSPEADLRHLMENKANVEARIRELEGEVEALGKELARLNEIENKVKEVEEEVKSLRTRLDKSNGILSQLKASISELESEAKRLRDLINKRSERLRFIRSKIQEVVDLINAIDNAKPALRKALLNAINDELKDAFKMLRHKESLIDIYVTEDYEVMVKRSDGKELPVSMLSMGERNLVALVLRFALSKAILGDIPIMLLDEPTEHLDSEHRRRVSNWLRDLSNVVDTLVVTSHVDAFENTADNVIRVEVINPRGESVAYNA